MVDVDRVIELGKLLLYDDAEQSKIWAEAVIECKDVKAVNRCDQALAVAECFVNGIRHRGLDPKSVII